jgi:hypothetical protein
LSYTKRTMRAGTAKPIPSLPTTFAHDEGIQANHIAIQVDEWASTVSRIDGSVRLDVHHRHIWIGLSPYGTHNSHLLSWICFLRVLVSYPNARIHAFGVACMWARRCRVELASRAVSSKVIFPYRATSHAISGAGGSGCEIDSGTTVSPASGASA